MVSGLEGIRVIQTATAGAVSMAGRLLADWGADVIIVENATRNARITQMRNVAQTVGMGRMESSIDYDALNINRNKRSMTLNITYEDGREILYKLFWDRFI